MTLTINRRMRNTRTAIVHTILIGLYIFLPPTLHHQLGRRTSELLTPHTGQLIRMDPTGTCKSPDSVESRAEWSSSAGVGKNPHWFFTIFSKFLFLQTNRTEHHEMVK
jgi:hypothetical protein